MNVTAPTVVRVAQQIMDDDADSLSLSSFGSRIRGDVPKTVMTGKLTTKSRNKQKKCSSVSTCPSTCSSSVVSLEGQDSYTSYTRGRGRKSKSSRTLEKEIIAHLREELAQVKAEAEEDLAQARAEAENSRALVQKLIVENEMIRQEANGAHAQADDLEKKARQPSSPAIPFSVAWRRVAQSVSRINVGISDEEEAAKVAPRVKFADEASDNALPSKIGPGARNLPQPEDPIENNGVNASREKMVSVDIPPKEGVRNFQNLLQRATSISNLNSLKPSVEKKEVSAEELLWDSYDWKSALDANYNIEHGLV
uniref:Uncharacterized protein n=1 Tax=Helicotheca tamesis TaxID=374047 RepID=A0A7S2IEN7_9STRA|mmetsp:Transcript_856/g.1155  ORF Transcript_856/g.1155 Transcript_856/m.1155 type:complete len:310 (+) Transcript_856:103-1032(+)